MRYSIEPRERGHVKGYGFLSFARNIETLAAKVAKIMSNKHGQKTQKTAEATGDLVGIKIADKITNTSKKYLKKSRNEEIQSNEVNNEIPKERYISLNEKQQIIDELRLT